MAIEGINNGERKSRKREGWRGGRNGELDLMGKSKNHTEEDGGSLTPEDEGGGGEVERREKVG